MAKMLIIFIGAIVALQVATSDLLDEANQQLENLRELVEGQISRGSADLRDTSEDFLLFSVTTRERGGQALEVTFADFSVESQQLRDLGEAGGQNVSICVDNRLVWMSEYLQDYKNGMAACMNFQIGHLTVLQTNALYLVDIIITKVHDLEFQLVRCNGEILCIAPVITEIELDEVRLPQRVREEVLNYKTLVDLLKPSVEECSSMMVTQYAREGNEHLREMEICINHIIGSKSN